MTPGLRPPKKVKLKLVSCALGPLRKRRMDRMTARRPGSGAKARSAPPISLGSQTPPPLRVAGFCSAAALKSFLNPAREIVNREFPRRMHPNLRHQAARAMRGGPDLM
jgi:hypothetical protein